MTNVKPLGAFGPRNRAEFDLDRATLLAQGTLDAPTREHVTAYLRSGTLVLALMEYTTDVIDGAFGVSGGSGILTDGTFYWRVDAADYVEHHGVAIDDELVAWMEQHGWSAPRVPSGELAIIDGYLFERLRS